ncbi:MAG: type II CRISPR-associated endonuclease Cas1 [Endomicrobia bacterium]|nr:type II CRISPR-associated endonuclease Cas1 [Endomicrobiia bacterium]MCL2506343.1 type II CRISPR-associated endonuclease Cas1 [Endomicrobiia bacterium]
MANNHIISIEKPAKLSIDTGRLEINFIEKGEKHYFAPFDIAVLILAHTSILLSSAVSKELSNAGVAIVYVGDNYMPIGITLPIGINLDGAKRPHLQAKYINSNLTKPWWRQVIKSKILGQASVLEAFAKDESQRLTTIANKVIDGDDDNKEGQSARFYWDVFFGVLNKTVRKREKQGATDVINSSLNYAYAIIRSMVARSLVSAGLCLNLGIGHSRRDNPFNLVEDFIEPFRFVADKVIFEIFSDNDYESLNTVLKRELLSRILQEVVRVENKNYRLFEAVDFMVDSFCNTLEDPRRKLLLPNMPTSRGVKMEMPELFHTKYEI